MKYWHLGALLLAAGCNKAGYDAVTIRPTYGWTDGCTPVKISGHGFGDEVSATVGGEAVTDLTRPEAEEDQAFFFFANTPPNAGGAQDVTVTSDGKEATIPSAFYYVACPGAAYVEVVSPEEGIAAGDTVSISGCGIDASTMSVVIADPTGTVADTTASLTSDCGTAYASFTAPTAADGTYYLLIVETSSGDVVNPATGDPRTCVPDTGSPCDPAIAITYGGAE